MQEKKLHKLGKTDLLTLIYKQEKQIQQLTKEVEELKQQLEDRTIQIKEAGSIAEASLKINQIFEVAQKAADEYLKSIKEVNKPSHECAEINEITSKDKAKAKIQEEFLSQNTYEEKTNDKITKELILINNKLIITRAKFAKKVLILFVSLKTSILKLIISLGINIKVFSKKTKLVLKIGIIKLKSSKNRTKRKLKRKQRKVRIKIIKSKRFLIKKIVSSLQKLAKKRLIKKAIRKLKKQAKKSSRVKLLQSAEEIEAVNVISEINEAIQVEETKIQEEKNALILVKSQVIPFKIKFIIRLATLLKQVRIKIKIYILKGIKKLIFAVSKIIKRLVFTIKKIIAILKKAITNIKNGIIRKANSKKHFIKTPNNKIKEKLDSKKNKKQKAKEIHKATIKNLQISMPDLEKELKRRKQKKLKISFIKTLAFSAMVIIAFAIITSTSFFKILQVSGTSMEPTLSEGQLLITSKFFKYKKGDIVAFYYNDNVLIKRVIATENDTVHIEYDGTVYVNSVKIEEEYVQKLSLGNCDITFPYQVPKNSVFILGDNRESSIDSRSKSLGSISKDKIIGKIQFKLNPFVIY